MMDIQVFLGVVCVCSLHIQQTDQCIDINSHQDLPSFSDHDSGSTGRINRYYQAIVPSYQFQCCGEIRSWGVDVEQDEGMGESESEYTLNLQVWRPSPTVDDQTGSGDYSLVGNNRFSAISLSGGVAEITPSPQDYIQFQPGDVLGFYVEEARNDDRGVVVVTTDSYTSELVWLASATSQIVTGCPISVGSEGDLTSMLRAAPIISISAETSSCPRILPTPPPCPTTPPPTTTMAMTEEPTTPETTTEVRIITEPTTEEPTTTGSDLPDASMSTGMASSSTSKNIEADSSTPTENTLPTDATPNEVVPMPDSEDDNQASVIAAVVLALLVAFTLTILISVLIAVVLSKKRSKTLNVTHTNLSLGIVSNQLYGQNPSVNDPTYDYVDDQPPTLSYKRASDIIFNGKGGDAYHESVLYHSSGPSASKALHSGFSNSTRPGAHIYDDASVQVLPGGSGEAASSVDPLYEVPLLSEPGHENRCPPQSIFETSGIYVPTEVERTYLEGDHYEINNTKKYNKLEFFVEDDIYWAPASTTAHLYSQLASKKYREILRNQLSIQEKLGSGQFGEVCKAVWSISGTTKELAIKTLRADLPEEEKVRFLQEAAIMGQFFHPNVIKLYGVVTVGEPVMICIELMSNGDLRGYLCSIITDKESCRDLEMQFLRFTKQIATGMEYLAKKSFIHRDLAARNILLDNMLNCKIGDFGLSRDLVYETYYTPTTKGAKLPVKWMAPEALLFKKYSTDSDVWSYGMVLFEIWSIGEKPFPKISNTEVIRKINTGYNQPPPPGCPRAIYKLMVDCWNPVHSKRPSFSEIDRYLSKSNDHLLQWVEEADLISSRARELGAPLSEAESLYKDLQTVYADTQ